MFWETRHSDWQMAADISNGRSAFIFRVKKPKESFETLAIIYHSTSIYSYPKRLVPSPSLWEIQASR
jgi:hypothetical protein